ncbi:MAG: phosphomannose isomerase type II C-terminal cupin domain [Candidatus Aminicenantes bacterium]|nr:phosphomannose isomerase type II C-terminal cupin domain [Candidatus Aminicenantes bacterium]
MPQDPQDDPRSLIYREQRPWGAFRRFTHNRASTVKIITVNPGQVLSLQLHRHRDELWVALDPGLRVTVGERTWEAEPCEEIYIPRQTRHRAAGAGPRPSRWLEIAFGEFDEEDIVRLEDRYGRG